MENGEEITRKPGRSGNSNKSTNPDKIGSSSSGLLDENAESTAKIQCEKTKHKRSRKPKQKPQSTISPTTKTNITTKSDHTQNQMTTQEHTTILNTNAPLFVPIHPSSGTTLNANTSHVIEEASKKPRRPRRKPKKKHGDEDDATTSSSSPHPLCLLCCNPMYIVSFGPCNHHVACATCCLRFRICYNRKDCPLCKAAMPTVILAPNRPDLPPFSYFIEHPEATIHSRGTQLGPGKVLVDRWQPVNRQSSSRLYHSLLQKISLSCSLCSTTQSPVSFSKIRELEAHIRDVHGKRICMHCLRERRVFPLDLDIYSTDAELQQHQRASHPECKFCRKIFFDADALWSHMSLTHHRCELCQPTTSGGDHPYFADASALQSHLNSDHYACEEPECVSSLIAFNTRDELKRHHIQRHSTRMHRWNASTSRPLPLDIQYVRRPFLGDEGFGGGAALGGVRNGDTAGGLFGAASNGRRRTAPAPTSMTTTAPTIVQSSSGNARRTGNGNRRGTHTSSLNERPPTQSRQFNREIDGGYHIVDDDIGMLDDLEYSMHRSSIARDYAGGGGAGGDSSSMAWPAVQEQFPSLASSAASTGDAFTDTAAHGGNPSSFLSASASASQRGKSLPPLVKHTVHCPCGRKKTHLVLEEGQMVPGIKCDSICQIEGRKEMLADAFGIDDPDNHRSVFSKREATWNGLLLSAAKQNPSWIENIEKELGTFIGNKDMKRYSMPPMSRPQRAIVHELAEQYGLATVSSGHEPKRYVELYKAGTSFGIPSRLLTRVAPTVSNEEIASLLKASEGFPIKFIDIAPTTDMRYYLRRWDGCFVLEWNSAQEAICTFKEEGHKNEVLDNFGGGIRGMFKIDRAWAPKTSVGSNSGGGGTHLSTTAPWVKNAAAENDDGSSGGKVGWADVAVHSVFGGNGRSSTGNASASASAMHLIDDGAKGEGHKEVKSGWTVIGGTRGSKLPPRKVNSGGDQGERSDVVSFEALKLADDDA